MTTDWSLGVDNAIAHLRSRKRVYDERLSFALIDYFAELGSVPRQEMERHFASDFVATTLGHLTTAVHGGGSIPPIDGWYKRDPNSQAYIINSDFANAWKSTRNLHPDA